jgi:methyl-accepting chemotaxis protein
MLEGQGLQTLIVAIPNAADLATSLKVEKGFYETGKVSIIDSAGNVVAAKDITDVGTVRYNIRPGSSEEVGYRDGLYYSAASLRSGQLRLIATLDAVEAAKPLRPLMTVYLAFAGLIVLVMLLQGFFIAPRLIEKPLAKLLKATQSVAEEDLRANLRKGFTGELKMLADGFSQMIVGLSRRRTISVRDSYGAEGGRAKVQISDFMPTEIKARLDGIAASLENAGADLSGHERDIASAATEIKSLAATIVDMNQLLSLRQDPARISNKEFRVCEMFTEVEDAVVASPMEKRSN